MKEITTPALSGACDYPNATELLMRRFHNAPDHIAFEVRASRSSITDPWRKVSTHEFVTEVRALAKGLMAAGLEPGETLAIMSPTRYEWALMDMAAWFASAVVVPIYETSALNQVSAILQDASVRFAVAGTAEQAQLLEEGFTQSGVSDWQLWSMDPGTGPTLTDLTHGGAHITLEALEARRLMASLDSVATIVYTSGTTAAPKGALITHGNFVGQVLSVAGAYTEVVKESGNTIIFLPMAHVLARGLQLICLANGMRIAHLSDTTEIVPALGVLKPTFLVVVPRVLQKIQGSAAAAASKKNLGGVWALAQATAVDWGLLAQERESDPGRKAGLSLRVRHALFDLLFYARIRKLVGGRLEYLLSGAAALDAELSLFFRGLGLPVIEGYGLTETTAPLTGNLPHSIKAGSVGVPMPGTTIRISENGEVLARGVGVFAGYNNPADNTHAFQDGFFCTGDTGVLDEQGRLTLTGRIKDVIITAGGKTISPTIWEGYVESDPLIAHAVMVGEGKPFLGGLVLLDSGSVSEWAQSKGFTDLQSLRTPDDGGCVEIDDARLRKVINKVVSAANSKIARSEQVRKIVLLVADLSEANGLVTPTMKLKRNIFTDRSLIFIDKIYAETRSQG
ncbi:AMP-dependent synthetase [Arthrobacter alpinus]|uniref:Acyl-CoA synthetase n=1 Tax=Arthrobacter alpinus TaxID=656366 RepID=A0A0M3UG89_9MICC|nr:AMP-dependent synthetase/ligase [Arthrobacter alpinus]ALE92339.1 AMP-dependent synthetase [Arthrobacter alpinus]